MANCPSCPGGANVRITPEITAEEFLPLLDSPRTGWPHGWQGFLGIAEGYRRAFQAAAQNAPPAPAFPVARGIVIYAGGWRYFPSLYVTVRAIRHTGCTLPIQVWFIGDRGEYDLRMSECLQDYQVGWIDASSFWRENPESNCGPEGQITHGWMLKAFAVAWSPFREVIGLDADCYPVKDPEKALLDDPRFKEVGAVFWPDLNPMDHGLLKKAGVQPPTNLDISFESGQLAINKAKNWLGTWLAWWLCSHYQYYFNIGYYGDKDLFLTAFLKANEIESAGR